MAIALRYQLWSVNVVKGEQMRQEQHGDYFVHSLMPSIIGRHEEILDVDYSIFCRVYSSDCSLIFVFIIIVCC